jgi:hypothetical protein
MLIMMSMMAIIVLVVGLVVFKLTRQLPSSSEPPEDHRLVEQTERIELLEDELQRVKDQADFTERLLTERDGVQPGDALEGNSPD